MNLHNKGIKAERDRVALLASYEAMCRVLRIRGRRRLTVAQIAAMPNSQLMQACKDIYNGATTKQANKIERIVNPPPPLWYRIKTRWQTGWTMFKARVYLFVTGAHLIDVPRVELRGKSHVMQAHDAIREASRA
jgi:hypothetical protein